MGMGEMQLAAEIALLPADKPFADFLAFFNKPVQ
jgi:hypothetical protein